MAFSTGFLKHRIVVQSRTKAKQGKFGLDSAGAEFEDTCELWAAVDWAKGTSALREGSLDAYAVVVVRMRWSPDITCRSRIKYEGKVYQILPETFHDDRQANTIQFTAQAIINDK